MTPEERRLLTDLANKVAQTPPQQRDAEAEDFIRKNIGSRPDALYLMTQTVLIQNMALEQAQQQIRDLQQQQQRFAQPGPATGGSGSFLGGPLPQPQYSQQPPYGPPPAYAPGPQVGGFGLGSSGPGFLRGAAQTAAGVAAGALAFEGIRSLFSHPGFGLLGGGSGLGFGGGTPVEETVINNYYDSPAGGSETRHQLASEHFADASDNSQTEDDSSDSTDDQTQDADYDDSSNYDSSTDDVA